MFRKLLILLIFIPFFQLSLIEAKQITGTIYGISDSKTKVTLPKANVHWLGAEIGAIADINGKFSIERPKDAHMLVASYVGYKRDTIHVEHDATNIEIVLVADLVTDEILIEENAPASYISRSEIAKTEVISTRGLQKAACCNLSESFQTNPSVDVNYSDAVTGAKTIQLLGLQGSYVQMLIEKTPALRGLAATNGLSYVPGPWMESIQISKGNSSVADGFESITGQINVEYQKPLENTPLKVNLYGNIERKLEANITATEEFNDRLGTALLVHGSLLNFKHDENKDGFLDQPLNTQLNIANRWEIHTDNIESRLLINGIYDDRKGGQLNYFPSKDNSLYGLEIKTKRVNAFWKTGAVIPGETYRSLAIIVSGTYHNHESFYAKTNYDGIQKTGYVNLIYVTDLFNEFNRLNIGATYLYDDYNEQFAGSPYLRSESIPGAYAEYTFSQIEELKIIAGARIDFNNLYGTYFTPRFHLRYEPFHGLTFRASAGKGYRTANVFAENAGYLASSRQYVIEESLQPEEAWNYGINATAEFEFGDRYLIVNAEFYRTDFVNQVVADIDRSPQYVYFHNLHGESYSNSFQIDATTELFNNFDITAAYRLNDVKTTINGKLREKPLTSRHKAFLNMAYATDFDEWLFDFTWEFNGGGRLPETSSNPAEYRLANDFPAYSILYAQITKKFDGFELYSGVENILDYKQENPIMAADKPFSQYFDASMVWAPIMGRNIYLGLRWNL